MSPTNISRRTLIGAGAATAAITGVPGGAASAAAGGPPNEGSEVDPSPTPVRRTEALAALGPTEQARFYPGIALIPGDSSAGATLVYVGNPSAGSHPGTASAWVGIGIDVPVGSVINAVDFSLYGSPRSGTIFFERYLPDTTGFVDTIQSPVPAGSGVATATLAVNQTYDGTQAFHAYHFGGTATSVCRGIRVRYTPPSAGRLVQITPKRVYDSRQNMAPDANGVLATGSNRTISVANGRDANGVVDAPNLVPAHAVAIAYTLTVADTVGSGFLAVNPGGTTTVSASTINWSSAGQALANSTIVSLGANRTITAVVGGGGSVNFLIDILGYFV